jgi:hypothetical protein
MLYIGFDKKGWSASWATFKKNRSSGPNHKADKAKDRHRRILDMLMQDYGVPATGIENVENRPMLCEIKDLQGLRTHIAHTAMAVRFI